MNELNSTKLGPLADLNVSRLNTERAEAADRVGQEDFLRLMTTQLQAQDPMEPMKTGEIFSQLAQFGTVSGIQELQSSFESLATNLQSMQALQASSMVGQTVLVESNAARLNSGEAIEGSIETPAGLGAISVSVEDASGQLVARLELPAQTEVTNFQWTGLQSDGTQAPPGIYTLRAQASVNGEQIGLTTRVKANVDSVTLNPGGAGYNLNVNGVGKVAPNDVLEVS